MLIKVLNAQMIYKTFSIKTPLQRRNAAMFCTAVTLACAALAHPALAEKPIPPEIGIWIDDTGQGAVEIKKCGRTLCGYVSWLKDPMSKRGGPKRDIYNPKPKNRENTICGLQVIGRLVPMADGSWDNGWIYDPKIGQSFDVAIRSLSTSKLEVHGYESIKILGKTFQWTRATEPLPTCSVEDQATSE